VREVTTADEEMARAELRMGAGEAVPAKLVWSRAATGYDRQVKEGLAVEAERPLIRYGFSVRKAFCARVFVPSSASPWY